MVEAWVGLVCGLRGRGGWLPLFGGGMMLAMFSLLFLGGRGFAGSGGGVA